MDKAFNKEMLQLARELRSCTQTELAKKANLTQAFVSQLERGEREISPDKLERVANALRFPSPFFYQPGEYGGVGISLLYYRKRSGASTADIKQIQAEVGLRRLLVEKMLRAVDIRPKNTFQFLDIDEYDGAAEQIAILVRASWGLSLGPIKNLTAAIESAGGIVFQFPFGTKDIDAISQWPDGLPPLFFVNQQSPADRARFSLSHELGHAIMHKSVSIDMEAEADRFASEFLMPEKDISSDLDGITIATAAALKPYWGTSIAALIRRSRDLGKITHDKYSYLFRKLSSLGMRKSEPGPLTPEVPVLFDKLLEVYRASCGLSDSDLIGTMFMFEADFTPRFLPKRSGPRLAV